LERLGTEIPEGNLEEGIQGIGGTPPIERKIADELTEARYRKRKAAATGSRKRTLEKKTEK